MGVGAASRVVRAVHAWAGAALCLILIASGASGALLVFKTDWLRATLPGASMPAPVHAASLARVMEQAEARFGAGAVRSVVFGDERLGAHKVALTGEGGAWLAADGSLIEAWVGHGGRPEDWLFELHHRLLSGETGEIVVGAAGLACALLVLTGVWTSLPALRAFAGRLAPAGRRRRDLIAAHRDLGLVAAAPVLIASLTGAAMVFDEPARALFQAAAPKAPSLARDAPPGPVAWPVALEAAQARFPDARLRIVVPPAAPGRPLTVRLRRPGEWHVNGRTTVWLEPATGRVLGAVDAMALDPGDRAWNAVWPVHAAKVGEGVAGRAVDVATAATGLGLAGLGAWGLWAFLLRPRARRRAPRTLEAAA